MDGGRFAMGKDPHEFHVFRRDNLSIDVSSVLLQ